jgi:hypothetical protein
MDLNNLVKSQWDRVAAIGLTAVGAIFLLIGWIGVSGTAFLAEQAPYILSGGIGGVFFLGVGATLWISADLRDEWRKLDRIETALGDGTLRWADDSHDSHDGDAGPGYSDELWSGTTASPRTATNGSSARKATVSSAKSVAAPKAKASTTARTARPRTSAVAHES